MRTVAYRLHNRSPRGAGSPLTHLREYGWMQFRAGYAGRPPYGIAEGGPE